MRRYYIITNKFCAAVSSARAKIVLRPHPHRGPFCYYRAPSPPPPVHTPLVMLCKHRGNVSSPCTACRVRRPLRDHTLGASKIALTGRRCLPPLLAARGGAGVRSASKSSREIRNPQRSSLSFPLPRLFTTRTTICENRTPGKRSSFVRTMVAQVELLRAADRVAVSGVSRFLNSDL